MQLKNLTLLFDMFVGGWEFFFFFFFCRGDWASEKLSWRVQLKGYSPSWRVLRNFSFQPC